MKKILVVDDNLLTLKQLEAQLSSHYEVMLAQSGAAALSMCKTEIPDLILLDVMMPDIDGFTLIKKFRTAPALEVVPVIVLTGASDTSAELRCLDLGVQDFMTKPVNRNILLNRIELHLRLSAFQANTEAVIKEMEEAVSVMVSLLADYHSNILGNHGEEVGLYTMALGKELLRRKTFGAELTETILEKFYRASILHDIGKIGISETIINKKGKYTEEEFDEMKKHPEIGAEVLSSMYKKLSRHHYLRCAVFIAGSHHEKWDGSGYPKGIKGEDIPLGARIVSVANVYAACRVPRPYRSARSHQETCGIIIGGRGKDFDARIVDVFEEEAGRFDELSKRIAAKNMQR